MSDSGTVETTFSELLAASVTRPESAGIHPDVMQQTQAGAQFKLPLRALAQERLAVIGVGDGAGGRVAERPSIEWLAGDAAESPIMALIRLIETPIRRGTLATGGQLPQTSMQAEHVSAVLTYQMDAVLPTSPAPGDLIQFTGAVMGLVGVLDEDGNTLADVDRDDTLRWGGTTWRRVPGPVDSYDYDMASVVEAKTVVSNLAIIQAGETGLDDRILEAHRLALQDTLLRQVLVGDGTGNNLSGIVGATGIQTADYVLADRGNSAAFQTAEDAVEDAGGRLPYMAWALGKDLSASARQTAIDPGGSRRTEERGRLTLSGLATQRIVDGLAGTTGILADWRTVVVPVADMLGITVNRLSRPGESIITSRLDVADPIVSAPEAVYALTQA